MHSDEILIGGFGSCSLSTEIILSFSDRLAVRWNFQVRIGLHVNGNNFVMSGSDCGSMGFYSQVRFWLRFDKFFLSG